MPSPRRKRSRSRSKEDFKYPASNIKELKALLLQFMSSEKFTCPLDSITLMRNLRMQFKTPLGRMIMKNFNINELLQELEDKKALKLESFSLGTTKCMMITSMNKDTILQLTRETSKDRPKKFPPTPVEQEKISWVPSSKTITFDHQLRSYKPEPMAFKIKGTVKDLNTADCILLNMVENKNSYAFLTDLNPEDWQNEVVVVIRDTCILKYLELIERWGLKKLGIIDVYRIRKQYMRKSLWTNFSCEFLLVAGKDVQVTLPGLIEYECEQELYKEIVRVFACSRPVEVFSKVGKDNWILVENL